MPPDIVRFLLNTGAAMVNELDQSDASQVHSRIDEYEMSQNPAVQAIVAVQHRMLTLYCLANGLNYIFVAHPPRYFVSTYILHILFGSERLNWVVRACS